MAAGLKYVSKPFSREESLSVLQPYVREWFEKNYERLTPPQEYSFKLIAEGKNVIVTGPTGSGKTLAGFLSILSELFMRGEHGELEEGIYVVYISPLRALNNDIRKNLLKPLKEIVDIAKEHGVELPEVRVGVRTGDISPSEKQRQLRKPPHILITTPESLAIILNAPKFSKMVGSVEWVIVDEIHELADNKRGAHLSLSLERLRELAGHEFMRIGLGATLHPLEEAAKFLVGYNDSGELRECYIVDVSWEKPYDLKVTTPVRDLIYTSAEEINQELYNLLDKLISEHKTTLIFTNTRSGTERVVYHLKSMWPEKYNDITIGAHHGSLSRTIRLDVEDRLKRGEMKVVVSSTSLELGIDVGYIELVIQIGSPKSVSRAVQRVGRSGHKFGDTAKGVFIAMDRDDVVELAVMIRDAYMRKLDRMHVVKKPLDILAQHIVGMALNSKWRVEDALRVIRRSYPFHELSEEEFKKLLHYLAGHYVRLEDRRVYGKIWYDESDGMFGRRGKYTRVIYYLNLGAIPDEVKIDVYRLPDKKPVGEIEEEFLERLRPGDIFVLGGGLYKFRYARGMRCYVENVPKDSSPTIPAWFSEMLPLSFDLALDVQRFRETVRDMFRSELEDSEILKWIKRNYPVDEYAAEAIFRYLREQYLFTKGHIPGFKEILVEETRDLRGRRIIVFHSLFGRRTNDVLSRVISIIVSDMIRRNVMVMISDNGFTLIIPEKARLNLEKVVESFVNVDMEELLRRNIRRTEMMKRRFRHCASRSFLVLRNYKGYKISVSKQQRNAQVLLNLVEKIDPEFPVIEETYREILMDAMDLESAKIVQRWIRDGEVEVNYIQTDIPSPFAHNLIVLGEPDIILMKDRKRMLMELHRAIMEKIEKLEYAK